MKIDVSCFFNIYSSFSRKGKSANLFSCKTDVFAIKQGLLCHPEERGIYGINKKRPSDSESTRAFLTAVRTDASCLGMTKKLHYNSMQAKVLVFFCFLFLTTILQAQVINLSFDKQKILLGEQIGVTAKAFVDKGKTLDAFPLDTLPHFEILQRSKVDTVTVGTTLQLSQTLLVTSWDSGRWSVPTQILGNSPAKPIFIEVTYTSPWNPAQPYHDIKGIVPVKAPGHSTWWWYLVGLAVLVALFLLFFPESKKEKDEVQLDKSAYKKALQQLDKLEREKLADPKVYYTELINIFRTYLKGAKGLQSFSKTTDDLSIQLGSQKLPSASYNSLVQTLRLSDLAKFAAYKPAESINKEAFHTVKQSITTLEQGHVV